VKSPRILLHGIGGVYNYGCEAILRGTELVLREIWPEAMIRYASTNPRRDAQVLGDSRLEIVARRPRGRYSLQNVVRKVAIGLDCPWNPLRERIDYLDDVDVVLSIGGDRYNLWPGGGYNRELIPFGEAVLGKGKKLVLWAASVGPFEANPRAEKRFRRHLSRMHLITAREERTIDYLATLGVDCPVVRCADPAFAVTGPLETVHRGDRSARIGVNLSPLSLLFQDDPGDRQALQRSHAHLLEELVRRLRAEIYLLPHVIIPGKDEDDDLGYLRSIMAMMDESAREHTVLLDNAGGFMGTKQALVQCDVVLAARMHCAINALATAIPTILISYSPKSVGMAQYVYGHTNWVTPIEQSGSEHMLQSVTHMLDQREAIHAFLLSRRDEIQQDVRAGAQALAGLLAD